MASLKVMVTVDVADPFAMTGDEPVMLEFAATAGPAIKLTLPPAFTTGAVIESVFDSALRDVSVQVEIPEASVTEQTEYALVVPESVAEKVGVSPGTGLLAESFSVMVTVEVATPSATTGPVPVIVEFATEAPAAVKTTFVPALTTGVAMERVFDSANRDASVQVEVPVASEEEQTP